MIVTCPNCAKRYMVDDALFPKEGRQVRCISCQHIWRQVKDVSSFHRTLHFMGANEEENLSHPLSVRQSKTKLWLFSFFVLFFSVSFIVIGRNTIVPLYPSLERYYELMGFPVDLAGSGLIISKATTHVHQEGPIEMVIVSGDLVNTSDRVRSIPPLKMMILGNNPNPKCTENLKDRACVLDRWDHRLSENSLLPGEQIHFETAPRPKIEGTSHITVEF